MRFAHFSEDDLTIILCSKSGIHQDLTSSPYKNKHFGHYARDGYLSNNFLTEGNCFHGNGHLDEATRHSAHLYFRDTGHHGFTKV